MKTMYYSGLAACLLNWEETIAGVVSQDETVLNIYLTDDYITDDTVILAGDQPDFIPGIPDSRGLQKLSSFHFALPYKVSARGGQDETVFKTDVNYGTVLLTGEQPDFVPEIPDSRGLQNPSSFHYALPHFVLT